MYILKKIKDPNNKFDISDVEFIVDTESLPDLLEQFECFLKAIGFTINGELDIVEFNDVPKSE